MSCGNAHGMECSEALARMVFFIDNELAEADCAEIRQHLDECAPCVGHFDLERMVKALVAKSCCERAPEDLRSKVLWKIRQVQLQVRLPD